MPGLWVGGGGSRSQDELDDAQGGEFFPLEWRIFNLISFELAGESLVQADMSLGVRGVSAAGKAIQEVSRCNCPP